MKKTDVLYNFESIEVLWRYIDEENGLDLDVNLVINGSVCFDIDDDYFTDTFTSNIRSCLVMAFQKMDKEKISYFDLNGKKKEIVWNYVIDELNQSGNILGVAVKNIVLTCKAKEEDEQRIKEFLRRAQTLKSVQTQKEQGFNLDVFSLLSNQTEWECNACGAKTTGLVCEYCGTPKIKI